MRPWICLFMLLSLSGGALAQWSQNGQRIEDDSSRKSVGDFGVMLILTNEPQKFVDDWEKPATPNIRTTSTAKRGKPLGAFLLFTGCAEVEGRCNAEVEFVILKPDGSVFGGTKADAPLWKHRAPPKNSLQLSESNLSVTVKPGDPPGKYRVEATARDRNAQIEVFVVEHFTVGK